MVLQTPCESSCMVFEHIGALLIPCAARPTMRSLGRSDAKLSVADRYGTALEIASVSLPSFLPLLQ
jgi:hypothetical protein